MSKLAHSDDHHMAVIETNATLRAERGERDEPAPLFTIEDDYVTRARADHHFQAGPGSLVQTPDGRVWTVVSFDLTGYGVIEGDQPQYINKDDDELVPPTHLLREPYKRSLLPDEQPLEFLGEVVRVIRRVKADGTVVNRRHVLSDLPQPQIDHCPDVPESCTAEAIAQGCTCTIPLASACDVDPPEPRVDRDCPLHGSAPDPDYERDRARDDAAEEAFNHHHGE